MISDPSGGRSHSSAVKVRRHNRTTMGPKETRKPATRADMAGLAKALPNGTRPPLDLSPCLVCYTVAGSLTS